MARGTHIKGHTHAKNASRKRGSHGATAKETASNWGRTNSSKFNTIEGIMAGITRSEAEGDARRMKYLKLKKRSEPPCCSFNPCDYLPKGSKFEPVTINFEELAAEKRPGFKWDQIPFTMAVSAIRSKLTPVHFIIDPQSMFMRRWDLIMLICLLYVAIVTPFQVGFVLIDDFDSLIQQGNFWASCLVDIFFVLDMILNFFLKVSLPATSERDMITLKSRHDIARHYLMGWFLIDLVSIVPVDVIAMSVESGDAPIEAIKLVRLLRLMKLMRVLRASRMIARWVDHFHLTFTAKDLLRLLCLLLFSSHLMACLWGLTGHFSLDMDCSEGYPVIKEDTKGTGGWPDGSIDNNWNWIVASYKGPSPDNMCDPFTVYIWALHFSVKTITSIGYGDVAPQRVSEFLVGILCMFWGGILWAYTIGDICATLGNVDSEEMEFRVQYDQINEMMEQQGIHNDLRIRVRRYMKEAKHLNNYQKQQEYEEVLGDVVGVRLHREVAQHRKYFGYVAEVPLLHGLGVDFTVQVTRALESDFFAPREIIPPYCRMWFIVRGAAIFDSTVHVRGMYFREDFLLDSLDLQLQSNCTTEATALTYCNALRLSKNSLVDILVTYPFEFKIIRKRTFLMMFRNAVGLLMRKRKESKRERDEKEWANSTSFASKSRYQAATEQKYRRIHQAEEARRLYGDKCISDISAQFASDNSNSIMKNLFVAPKQDDTDITDNLSLLNEVKHNEVDLNAAYAEITLLDAQEESLRSNSYRMSEENANLARRIQNMEKEVSHLRMDLDSAKKGPDGSIAQWPSETSPQNIRIAATLRNLQEKRHKRYDQTRR
jgi:hypothetical protein